MGDTRMSDPAQFGPSMLGRRVEAALRDVQSPKVAIRRAAARELAPHIDSSERARVVSRLTRLMLDDTDIEVRTSAILALLDGGATEVVDSMLAVARSGPPRIRQMALLALGELASPAMPEAVELALEAVESELPALRYQGLVTLRSLQQLDAIDVILRRAADGDPEVRWVAIRLLEELWTLGTVGALDVQSRQRLERQVQQAVCPLVDDDNHRVRAAAILVLSRLGDLEARHRLPRLLEQKGYKLGIDDEMAAIELAGQLHLQSTRAELEKRAWPWLFESARSWKARVSLAQLGDARARRAVLDNLYSKSPVKCARAIEAAGQIGLEQARSRLQALLANPSVYDVEAIRTALQRLGPSP